MDTCAPACVSARSQLLALFLELEITFLVGWNGFRAEAASTLDVLKRNSSNKWESLDFESLVHPKRVIKVQLYMNAKCPLLLYLLLRASAAGQFLIPGRCPCLLFGKVSSARFHLTKVIRDHSLRSLQKIFEYHLNTVKDFFNVSLASNYRIVLVQFGKNKRLQFLETANCIPPKSSRSFVNFGEI